MNSSSTAFIRFIIQLVIFWLTVHLINHSLLYFRQTKRTYLRFLRAFGCQVSLFNIGFYTTSFNWIFHQIGRKYSRFWKIWFTFGILVTLITAIVASCILLFLPLKYLFAQQQSISTLDYNVTSKNLATANELSIQPVIPGVNVPMEQMLHFGLTLLACAVFHEFGHAIAAAAEQVRVNGCGYFLFVLYPGAYVELNHEQVEMITAYRQLRIYCAGVFHNLVLVIIAVICLLVNPYVIRRFYVEAAVVSRVSRDSPIYSLLPVHSAVQFVDGCNVNKSSDWYDCLRLISNREAYQSSGYCLTQAEIQLLSSHIEINQTKNYDCCQNLSQKNYCFLYHSKQHSDQNGACMEARSVTSHPPCLLNSDCQRRGSDASCVHPFSIDNVTRLMRIGHDQGPPILFVGSISELYRTIQLQSYQAKYNFLSTILITDIPLFFQYVATFSFALAFFNAIPCYALDGQYILFALIEYLSPSLHRKRRNFARLSLIIGTCLLIFNIILAFVRYFV